MALVTVPVGSWGNPTIEAYGYDGGFNYTYDDSVHPVMPPLLEVGGHQPVEPAVPSKPDESWLKADIQAWLDGQGIDYQSSATKADLLALVP